MTESNPYEANAHLESDRSDPPRRAYTEPAACIASAGAIVFIFVFAGESNPEFVILSAIWSQVVAGSIMTVSSLKGGGSESPLLRTLAVFLQVVLWIMLLDRFMLDSVLTLRANELLLRWWRS